MGDLAVSVNRTGKTGKTAITCTRTNTEDGKVETLKLADLDYVKYAMVFKTFKSGIKNLNTNKGVKKRKFNKRGKELVAKIRHKATGALGTVSVLTGASHQVG